jgi:hypothetical protein
VRIGDGRRRPRTDVSQPNNHPWPPFERDDHGKDPILLQLVVSFKDTIYFLSALCGVPAVQSLRVV